MDTADKAYRQMALYNLLKDSALAAFALYIASNARHQRILENVEEEVKEPEERFELVEQ
jgi:putative oxidoreductase